MIANVSNHHSSVPAAETKLGQPHQGSTISSASFREVLVNHFPSPNTPPLPNLSVTARGAVSAFTTLSSSPSSATTSSASTITTPPGTYTTPFGTVVVTQPVTPSLTAVFTPKPSTGAPVNTVTAPQQQPAPTPQSVFGDQVWMPDASYTAPDGSVRGYNPIYFASPATAQKVADMFGGKVVSMNMMAYAGGMLQSEPNLMVQLPNGKLVNPGLIADYYNHGYPQSYVDALVKNEIQGAQNS
jgi:hypothetical protein